MTLLKAIFGGFSIGIGSLINLNIGGLAGAILFSIGLITILECNFKLYTGAIGYVHTQSDLKEALIILLGNIIGTFPLINFYYDIDIINLKLDQSYYSIFIKSFLCGILVYTAVEAWKNKQEWIVVLAVSGFILAGGEHCIADICYCVYSRTFNIHVLIFLIIVILGNSCGALCSRLIQRGRR